VGQISVYLNKVPLVIVGYLGIEPKSRNGDYLWGWGTKDTYERPSSP